MQVLGASPFPATLQAPPTPAGCCGHLSWLSWPGAALTAAPVRIPTCLSTGPSPDPRQELDHLGATYTAHVC